jgi:hypothetical protein
MIRARRHESSEKVPDRSEALASQLVVTALQLALSLPVELGRLTAELIREERPRKEEFNLLIG